LFTASDSSPRSIERTVAAPSRPIWLLIGLTLAGIAYLAQIPSPLRLTDDSVIYLSLATSAVEGKGFVYHGSPERYPLGYPMLIFLLVKAGLGYSSAFTALNCVFVALGVLAGYHILCGVLKLSEERALLLSLMTLLSFVLVKHVTQMLSDTAFFGISMCCLWMLLWTERSERIGRRMCGVIFAIALAAFSTSVRMIGIALLPAIILVAVGGVPAIREWVRLGSKRTVVVVVTSVFFLALVCGLAIVRTQYFKMATASYRARGLSHSVRKAVEFQVAEWGELVVNLPAAKLPGPARPLIFFVGIVAIAITGAGMWLRRKNVGPLECYLWLYLVILCAAPWQDTRYLLPIVPLILGYISVCAERISHRFAKPMLAAYVVYFLLLGAIALAYSTRITYSGASFPDMYGDGSLRVTYREALGASAGAESSQISPEALDLLQRYEPRTRSAARQPTVN
jgi:hypothetical protein